MPWDSRARARHRLVIIGLVGSGSLLLLAASVLLIWSRQSDADLAALAAAGAQPEALDARLDEMHRRLEVLWVATTGFIVGAIMLGLAGLFELGWRQKALIRLVLGHQHELEEHHAHDLRAQP